MTEKEKAFLDELTELSKKHGLIIDGCGCCGSPYFDEFAGSFGAKNINGEYVIIEHGQRMEKSLNDRILF
jgi:hypothetical protein